MKRLLLAATLFSSFLLSPSAFSQEPLRVFIRAGAKSHGPGAHDFPQFLKEWVPLLNERGAKADGGLSFPTKEQLDKTDVLILHAQEAGNIALGEERKNLLEFIARGGGIVTIHAGAVSRDPEWFKGIVGGSWNHAHTKWLEGPMHLYFTDKENPITKEMSNFAMDDEIYYDMDILPECKILAGAYTPKPLARNEKSAKKAAESTQGGKKVSVYDVQPQVWTYEKESYRSFVCIPGHYHKNFDHPVLRALILRGIAWAGKRTNTDEFCKPEELGDNLRYVEGGPTRPDKAAEKLEVHPEFNIQLVASEPLINKAMNVDWDEKGRLWVCETPEYPNGLRQASTDVWKESGSVKPGKYERDPIDRISWLEDTNGDGVMDKKHVFADKLELVTSFVFYKTGVIATSAPDIWFLDDTDGDGVCDKRTKLYTGLGKGDTHAVINNARWGLDGWIYATNGYSTSPKVTNGDGSKDFGGYSAGVIRFKPDGSAFEQYSSKGSNTWGLTMTWDGQCFFTQPTCGDVLMHVVLPESVLAKGKMPGTNSYNVLMKGESTYSLMKWEEQAYVQIDQVGKFTAAAGCAIYEGGAWPDKWKYSYFTTEPTINIVSHRFVTPDGVTYKAEKEKGREETEFIRSKDLWFRPIENRIGPDGALYVVDFYNQAVIHNDTRGPQHGPAGAAVRPDRDHYFSRIWKVQHKDAKKLDVPVLDKSKFQDLSKVIKTSPNAHVKQLAWRLATETLGFENKGVVDLQQNYLSRVGSQVMKSYNELLNSVRGEEGTALAIESSLAAKTDWERSAVIAAISTSRSFEEDLKGSPATGVIIAALNSDKADQLAVFVSALLPRALNPTGITLVTAYQGPEMRGTPGFVEATTKLLVACTKSPSSADGLKSVILRGIAQQTDTSLKFDPIVVDALKKLLANPATASAALPIVAKWDKDGVMKEAVNAQVTAMLAQLADDKLSVDQRAQAASGLLAVRSANAAVLPALTTVLTDDSADDLKRKILSTLGEADDIESGKALISVYAKLNPALQTVAFDQLIKRPDWSSALLEAVKDGGIKTNDLGPANVARLRTHPDKQVAKLAASLLEKLNPSSVEKNKLLATLTPEVEKPGGSPEKGKMLFTAACAICHKLGQDGKEVGPNLDGMGAHSPADLLVAVLDPNREVDPTFYVWNIVKKNGEALAGVIAQENTATLQLRNQAGTFEIPKDQIASRENTNRSLMPDGLEALGAENLRDLMAFMNASETRFRIVPLTNAYTADTRRGLFASEEATGDTVHFAKFGNITAEGVPYFIQDPTKSQNGANIIALKGGGGKAVAQSYPERVEIAMNMSAKRLHLLSGIAGWGYPATQDDRIAMKITVTHADGQSEVTELKNGEAFSDYNRVVEVPGSELVEDVVTRGQLRRITLAVKNASPITKLVLESFDNGVTPVVCAITADIAGAGPQPNGSGAPSPIKDNSAGKMPALPENEMPVPSPIQWEQGKTKVLIVAGGSSHDFKKWFMDFDAAFLKEAGYSVNTTENSAQATAELKNADVAIISTNRTFFDTLEWRAALFEFVAAGKGVIMLHPGTWYGFGKWPELNAQIVGGGSRGHDKLGNFQINVLRKDHAIMIGVPHNFEVFDELYYMNAEAEKIPAGTAPIEVLAETSPSQKYGKPHPSVWITDHPKARIVGIALGHDGKVHGLPAFKAILTNSVKWVNGN